MIFQQGTVENLELVQTDLYKRFGDFKVLTSKTKKILCCNWNRTTCLPPGILCKSFFTSCSCSTAWVWHSGYYKISKKHLKCLKFKVSARTTTQIESVYNCTRKLQKKTKKKISSKPSQRKAHFTLYFVNLLISFYPKLQVSLPSLILTR